MRNLNHLKYGIADYWYAKVITMFSKNNLRVYSVYPSLMLYQHNANIHWYFGGNRGKYNHPVFNFIVEGNFEGNQYIEELFKDKIDTLRLQNVTLLKVPEFKFDDVHKKPLLCNPGN